MRKNVNFALNTVKNNGFSYLEIIFSLFLIINIFVLFTQMFYNINVSNKYLINNNTIKYETAVLRIEYELKEATNLVVANNFLEYRYRDNTYRYLVFNKKFALRINFKQDIYFLYDIKEVNFYYDNNFIYFTITNTYNNIYETKIIVPTK